MYTSQERPDITRTPVPLWSLIDVGSYAAMEVQFSRGCPFDCEFCDIVIMNGRSPRTKTPGQMTRELQALYDIGWRSPVFIVDDNFIGNKRKAKKILAFLIDWQQEHRFPFTFLTGGSVNLAKDEELMRLMSTANFIKVFIGIETPNADSLEECGKNQNVKSGLAESVDRIQRHGMQVRGGFIFGFDRDPEDIFDIQLRFIQQLGAVAAMVGVLTALPQTRLWHLLKAEGQLLKTASGENTDGQINFIPRMGMMGMETLINGYRILLAAIYSPGNYYQRIGTFLKSYNPTARARLGRQDILAFLRSMWSLGLISKVRFRYWRLIMKTLIVKRKALPMAVELTIMGLHFKKVLERVCQT